MCSSSYYTCSYANVTTRRRPRRDTMTMMMMMIKEKCYTRISVEDESDFFKLASTTQTAPYLTCAVTLLS